MSSSSSANEAAIHNGADQGPIDTIPTTGTPGNWDEFNDPITDLLTSPVMDDQVAVINDLSTSSAPIRELTPPPRARRVRRPGPPKIIDGIPFFETHASLDSAKSSKWCVSLRAHCHLAFQLLSSTARTVRVVIPFNGELVAVYGHIRPRSFTALFSTAQLEQIGITRGVPFLCALSVIDVGTPVAALPRKTKAAAPVTEAVAAEAEYEAPDLTLTE